MKLDAQKIKEYLLTQPNFSASSYQILNHFGMENTSNHLMYLFRSIQYTKEIRKNYCYSADKIVTLLYLTLDIELPHEERLEHNDNELEEADFYQ